MATNPNKVIFTGENSGLTLSQKEGEAPSTRSSHWRVLWSPAGMGHVLYIQSELTNNERRIYSDNIALTRWLQEGIYGSLSPAWGESDALKIPVIDSEFSREGDSNTFWTERIESDTDSITMTWYDFLEPFAFGWDIGDKPDSDLGVSTVVIPGGRAQLAINGVAAAGQAFAKDQDGRPSSTCCLAISETWIQPYK